MDVFSFIIHEAEIFAKASNCFRTEATALLDSFFLAVLLAATTAAGLLRGEKVRTTALLSGVAVTSFAAPAAFTGVILVGVVRAESGRVFGEEEGDCVVKIVARGVALGDGCGDDEQLKMSSPYLAMRSARLKSGLAGAVFEDRSEGGELSDDEESRESFDSLSELLSRVRLLRRAGLAVGLAPNVGLEFLNMW